MPRPAQGYTNAAGKSIPGTHDPINRFMGSTALKFWAYKRGQKGLPLWLTGTDVALVVLRATETRFTDHSR